MPAREKRFIELMGLFGRDITRLPPNERVRLGICQVPEGRHVFGPMSIEDNLPHAIAEVTGMGQKRLLRYGAILADLLTGDIAAHPEAVAHEPEP